MPAPRRGVWRNMVEAPLGHGIAVAALVSGAAIAASAVTSWTPSRSIDDLPVWVAACVGVLYLLGGVATVVALQWRGSDVSRGWDIHRGGLWFIAAGHLLYVVIVAGQHPLAVTSWSGPLAIAAACMVKAIQIGRRERDVREDLARITGERSGRP